MGGPEAAVLFGAGSGPVVVTALHAHVSTAVVLPALSTCACLTVLDTTVTLLLVYLVYYIGCLHIVWWHMMLSAASSYSPGIGTPQPSWQLGLTPTAGNRSAAKAHVQPDPLVRPQAPCAAAKVPARAESPGSDACGERRLQLLSICSWLITQRPHHSISSSNRCG